MEKTQVKNTEDETIVARECRGYDLVIASNEKWGPAAFSACSGTLRLLVRYGIGYDTVDLKAASAAGIIVTNLPGCNAESVAEHTVALILTTIRDIVGQHNAVKRGVHTVQTAMTRSLQGKTVGLLGCGHIGRAVARMLHGFPCTVVAYDLVQDEKLAKQYAVEWVTREELLARSDIVSIHLPFNPATKWTIDSAAIAQMKQDAIIINTSRGGLVNSDDLAAALREKRLYAAGLDVFEGEVDTGLPLAHQFLDLDNVVLTPHTASLSYETFGAMMWFAVEAIENFLNGKSLPGQLNAL